MSELRRDREQGMIVHSLSISQHKTSSTTKQVNTALPVHWLRGGGTNHISKVSVQDLNEVVDDFEHQQFVVFRITPDNEEERGVPVVRVWCEEKDRAFGRSERRTSCRRLSSPCTR